ncbi:MAG: hypothetical protein ACRDNF_14875 [Streptosporangiaceae bacterium]
MRNRIPTAVISAAVLLAAVATASGCASRSGNPTAAADSGKSPTVKSLPVDPPHGAPNIPVVQLGPQFAPNTLKLGAGQHFLVIVSKSDQASGDGMDGACTTARARQFTSTLLSLRCQGSSYLYTALRTGSTALAVTVRPACATGVACPQWIARASLRITIT